jgi:hypothetical protein
MPELNQAPRGPVRGNPILLRQLVARSGILLFLCLALSFLFPLGTSIELEYRAGGVWVQEDLIAPFPFPIYREETDYAKDVAEARNKAYMVFESDSAIATTQLASLRKLFDEVSDALTIRMRIRQKSRGHDWLADSARYSTLKSGLAISFNDRDWEVLEELDADNRLNPLRERLHWILETCWGTGVLDRPKTSLSRQEVAVREGREETLRRLAGLFDQVEIMSRLDADLRDPYGGEERVFDLAYRIGASFIRPNLLLDERSSELALAALIESIPRTIGFVQENERIVSKHERIADETRLKLESYRRARAERADDANTLAQFAGVFLHVLMLVVLYGIYLAFFRKKIFADNRRLILVALLILVQGCFAFVTRELDVEHPMEYLITVPVSSMLLAIFFDSRVAFYGTVIIAFLVAAIMGNNYAIAVSSVVAGALAVYTVRDIRNRTQIFRSMGFIFLGYGVSIIALALEQFAPPAVVISQLSFALINALVSPVLTYGLLIFCERAFRMTTDLTLIELLHFNHPLLRELAEKAPGTYHHSMTIASLAETAAASIGANEVLAKAGAFFHDVGKLAKPSYFVENQRGSRNRHEKISPMMSSRIIQAHVRDGIALGNQHHLPEEVIDFIPMHHGTTKIEYFYDKALRIAEQDDGGAKKEEIREADYRYPGPRPQTKETGILMLADTIEARVRSLDDHSQENLERTIDDMVRKRFEEGELDECPLTLRDLTRIREAFLRVLVGVYHARVKYPLVETRVKRKAKGNRRNKKENPDDATESPRPDEPAL